MEEMINDTVSTPVTKPYQYLACMQKGRIHAVMQNFPPAPLTAKDFEITEEEFYFLRMLLLHKYNVTRAAKIIRNIQRKMKGVK